MRRWRRIKSKRLSFRCAARYARPLRVEMLEDRRLLATFSVTNLLDGSVFAAGDLPGSLRQAVFDANAAAGSDTIDLSGVSGNLLMTKGEFVLTETVTITGPGQNLLTIDAQHKSRIINFTGTLGDLTLDGLTLQNGRTSYWREHGGGIQFLSSETLTLIGSTIAGNGTKGNFANGGGIYAHFGAVTLIDSTLSGNSTLGRSYAGGIGTYYGAVTLVNSIVSGNNSGECCGGIFTGSGNVTLMNSAVSGNNSVESGGGIYTYRGDVSLIGSSVSGNSVAIGIGGGITAPYGDVTLMSSTVSGNSVSGPYARGGGIANFFPGADVTLIDSTVSGNTAVGSSALGGGISADHGDVMLLGSTISGNSSGFRGGGIFANSGDVTLADSTVSGNRSTGEGGGLSTIAGDLTIRNSIVAGNMAGNGVGPDVFAGGNNSPIVEYSLIGDKLGTELVEANPTPDNNGNFIGGSISGIIDPLLGPLADNGGPTKTHALLPGSQALDAGDPSFDPNDFDPPSLYDQRGAGFDRVVDGGKGPIIDMGSYESQGIPGYPAGDYNHNGIADSADYTVWRDTLGSTSDLRANGDDTGLSMGVIDEADFSFWRDHYGNTSVSVTPAGSGAGATVDLDASLALSLVGLSQKVDFNAGFAFVVVKPPTPTAARSMVAAWPPSFDDDDGDGALLLLARASMADQPPPDRVGGEVAENSEDTSGGDESAEELSLAAVFAEWP